MISPNDSNDNALPTLQELRRKAALTSRQLAEAAGIPLRVEYLMEIGGRVSQDDAEQILAALSRLTGREYSLNNVQVSLTHEASFLPKRQPGSAAPTAVAHTNRKGHRVP
jgi:hypothetical protein